MDFLNNIPINSTGGFIGLALLVIGGFMVLAGVGIISIQQVTVKQGRATWVVGVLLAVGGAFLLYPELSTPAAPESPIAAEESAPGAEDVLAPTSTVGASPTAASAGGGELSDWRPIEFMIPGDGLWLADGGSFTAIGSKDTFVWSQEIFTGDVEISMDIESPVSFAAANIVVYGNGGSLTTGNLIFSIASDLQAISADSIYEGAGGRFLFSSWTSLDFVGQKHSILISILDRRAKLFLDGEEIGSVFVPGDSNTSGKIGLLKYWETGEITFSNIHVRSLEPVE